MRFLLLLLALAACGPTYRDASAALETVPAVDLARYAGRWHEIARFPVRFQEGCTAVTADYALRDDGRVDVVNACTRDGERDLATAIARPADATNARLKVKFVRWLPFEGDYWIIHLDEAYETAVVATPGGGAGWILARDPAIPTERLDPALAALREAGYDTDQLIFTGPPASAD